MLLTLDTEKIDKAIRDQELDQQLADLSLRLTELELPILERSTPLDLASAISAVLPMPGGPSIARSRPPASPLATRL